MFFIAWIIFFGMLVYLFAEFEAKENNPNTEIKTALGQSGEKVIRLKANRRNHYVLSGKINQIPVTFLVDTGATDVVVPESLANKLKLVRGHPMQARTASDIITVYFTVIDSLQLGEITLRKIRASINPHMPGHEILLGMSALKHFEITHRGEELILKLNAQ